MKDHLQKTFRLTVFCIFFGGALAVSAQTRPILGGYKTVPVSDAAVEEAANYAVETKGAELEKEILLEAIHKAEAQTVQGKNFRLCLEILIKGEEEDDGEIFFIKTVVYKSLKGEFKLTSWNEVEECGEQ